MTREEAIEVYNGLINTKIKEAFEFFVPELRESEDEKVRRWLVDYFKAVERCCIHWDISPERIVSYLEKQKEPDNVSATTMAPSCWEVEQKEQKPLITGNDFGWIDELKHDLEHPEELDQKVQGVLKKRQKPAEWSEEDEHRRTDAIYFLESAKSHYADTSEIEKTILWLKSLRPPQDRCKDCPHRGDMFLLTQGLKAGKHELAIRFMSYLDENRPEDKMGLSNSECEDIDKAFNENDWNKIIRYIEKYKPQWKPGADQMEALNYAIAEWDGGKKLEGLYALRTDLKKLM